LLNRNAGAFGFWHPINVTAQSSLSGSTRHRWSTVPHGPRRVAATRANPAIGWPARAFAGAAISLRSYVLRSFRYVPGVFSVPVLSFHDRHCVGRVPARRRALFAFWSHRAAAA
jgi:hypothetical protein